MNSTNQVILLPELKILWTVALLLLTTCTHAGAVGPQKNKVAALQAQRSWQTIDSITYRSADGPHQLVLYRKDLANFFVSTPAAVDKYMNDHPSTGGVPNTVYALLDISASTSKLRWVEYVCQNDIALPHEHWFANVVWPAGEANPYVIVTMSFSTHLKASVYRVLLKGDLGTLAEEPDLTRFNEWPVPTKPISKINIFRTVPHLADGVDGISNLTATAVGDVIELRGEREDKHSPPVYITFNLNTRNWQKGMQPDAMHTLDKMDKQE